MKSNDQMRICGGRIPGVIATLLMVGAFSGVAWSASDNLPPPAQFASQAEEYQQMTGAWCGKWSDGPRIRLRVDEIKDNGKAEGTYRWGNKNHETKFKGRVKDHVLRVTFPNSKSPGGKWLDADVKIWLTGADQAAGTWNSNKGARNKMARMGTLTIAADRCN